MAQLNFKRVLLKISGEVLGGKEGTGLDTETLKSLAEELKAVLDKGIQLALVCGAGNFFRGLSDKGGKMNRVSADYIGMLGTVMNALAVADFLKQAGVTATVQSAIEMPRLCDRIQPLKADKLLEKGEIVIFAGGTGNPFFSTDSTAALRAAEIGAEVVLKATKVDGVYSSDPVKDPTAKRFDTITYKEVLERKLKVMDLTAITFCSENKLPIIVFDMTVPGNIKRLVNGEATFTKVIAE
ncbi:UMP kinase [bacterium]|nr:UMP kinase [bacterium]